MSLEYVKDNTHYNRVSVMWYRTRQIERLKTMLVQEGTK